MSTRPYETCEVLVLGAGMAGLNAALRLSEAGVDVRVLEASARVGGRIHSIDLDGTAIDVGGTGYGPTHLRSMALIRRFGFQTGPLPRKAGFIYSVGGELVTGEAWPTAAANRTRGDERAILPSRIDNYYMQEFLPFTGLEDWLDPANAVYDIPFGDFLRGKGVSDEALRLVNTCINADDIDKVSALSIFRDAIKWREVGYTDPKNFNQYGDAQYQPVRLRGGGCAQLPEAMTAALPRPVEFGRRVLAVEAADGWIEATCENGARYRARRCVVALPMVTLRRIRFSPALPPLLAEAVASAKASGNTQFILRHKRRFWEDDGLPGCTWTDTLFERMFVAFDEAGEVDHIRVWINGDNAGRVDAMGVDADRALLDTFARLRPSTAGQLEVAYRISWGSDPLIGGEKHVLGPGEVTRYGEALAAPVGGLHWAGEHHRSKDQGLEAALQAGERAADEIIAA